VIRVLHVVGARPNFMKAAPIMRELGSRPEEFEQQLVHTGQHYDDDMSRAFFTDLDLPWPDVNLEVGSGSHAQQTAQVMMGFESVLTEYEPDWVLVPGDVNSTLACTLVAAKLGVKVGHVEAGLRSFDRSMPEELNRLVTDQLADLLFTPSRDADENLRREGIAEHRISFVGNVMIDTLVHLLPAAERRWTTLQDELELERYLVVTLHRPANVDDALVLGELLAALREISRDIDVIFPVHPRTRARMSESELRSANGLKLIGPVGYLDFLALETHASAVLTDSGGIQEETTYLGVPCVTARANTERPVTITDGTNRLVERTRHALVASIEAALASRNGNVPHQPPELWDGRTSARIADALVAARA
jgi:UDP-N-acetylglucosamine 2-epimerase (non-hydrolysing)